MSKKGKRKQEKAAEVPVLADGELSPEELSKRRREWIVFKVRMAALGATDLRPPDEVLLARVPSVYMDMAVDAQMPALMYAHQIQTGALRSAEQAVADGDYRGVTIQ